MQHPLSPLPHVPSVASIIVKKTAAGSTPMGAVVTEAVAQITAILMLWLQLVVMSSASWPKGDSSGTRWHGRHSDCNQAHRNPEPP